MLHIYLDQNKWVDLARAATGHPLGERFADALAMARAAVAAGEVSFPLDMYRYWETGKRGNDRSRNDVVDVMRELSQQQTMALPFGLLDSEIDNALRRRFGRPTDPRRTQVFGIGMRHIAEGRLEWPGLDLSALPGGGASVPAGMRAQLSEMLGEVIEDGLLRAGPATFRGVGFDHAFSDHGQRFVEFENLVAAEIAKHKLTGDAIDVAVRGTDFSDIRPALTEALGRIGMTYEDLLVGTGPADLMRLIDDLPTRYVTNVLRSAKHRQTQQKWEPNDFIDIVALPVAAVYCNVVVTEKQWVHHMRRRKVDLRYETTIISDVADLVDVLVGASVR